MSPAIFRFSEVANGHFVVVLAIDRLQLCMLQRLQCHCQTASQSVYYNSATSRQRGSNVDLIYLLNNTVRLEYPIIRTSTRLANYWTAAALDVVRS